MQTRRSIFIEATHVVITFKFSDKRSRDEVQHAGMAIGAVIAFEGMFANPNLR